MAKILLYAPVFNPMRGGMERYAEDLASELQEMGHQVVVLTPVLLLDPEEKQFNFRLVRDKSLATFLRIAAASDKVVCVGMTLQIALVGLFARRKLVMTHHINYKSLNARGRISRRIKLNLMPFFLNISVSNFIALQLPGRQIVIHNSFNKIFTEAKFEQDASSEGFFSIVFCGRLIAEKGCGLLCEAFVSFAKRYPESVLTIIGDGPQRAHLENYMSVNSGANRCRFLGSQPIAVVATTFARATVVVVPSVWQEPFGIVAIEALAAGCIVVATSRGGLPEAVGEAGLLVEPSAKAILSALINIRNGEWQPPSDDVVRAHISRFEPQRWARKYSKIMRLRSPHYMTNEA